MSIDRAPSNVRPAVVSPARLPSEERPVMDSQKTWLAGEAAKMGRSVFELSMGEMHLISIAHNDEPSLTEIVRIQGAFGGLSGEWSQLDKRVPDPSRPVMDSQKTWLAAEAAKLGRSVKDLTPTDIVTVARQSNVPGPSEIERIQSVMLGVPNPPGFRAAWAQLDEQKPDVNKPLMESQKSWLADEAKKIGKPVAELSPNDILNIARQSSAPGPAETARIKAEVARIERATVASPDQSGFVSGSSTTAANFRPTPAAGSTGAFGSVLGARIQTQADMNIQAGKTVQEAQVNLAAAESAERFGRTGPLRQLQESEGEAFEHYATAAAAFAASAYQGGSLAPYERASALTDLFNQRTTLVQGRNVEGVVAAGSTGGAGLHTQSDMNQDAGFTLGSARAELESATSRVRLRLQDSPRAQLFEESCKAFTEYAAAASDTAGFRVRGGSLESLARAGAEEALVRQRTALLEQMTNRST